MPNKNFRIPEHVLDKLEEKIYGRIIENIENVVAKKCEELLVSKLQEVQEPASLERGLTDLRKDLMMVEKEMKSLNNKTDHLLGSVSYLADEYDDFRAKIPETTRFSHDISNLKLSINEIMTKQESLEQYGRRDNLELHGIPEQKNENTNFIVKKFASKLNLKLEDQHISTSHRLPAPLLKPAEHQPRPIIVKFSNRDVRNQLYQKRSLIPQITNFELPGMEFLYITENLTKYRKELFVQAKRLKQIHKYQYLWTNQGQIYMRRNANSKVIKISRPEDLASIR